MMDSGQTLGQTTGLKVDTMLICSASICVAFCPPRSQSKEATLCTVAAEQCLLDKAYMYVALLMFYSTACTCKCERFLLPAYVSSLSWQKYLMFACDVTAAVLS